MMTDRRELPGVGRTVFSQDGGTRSAAAADGNEPWLCVSAADCQSRMRGLLRELINGTYSDVLANTMRPFVVQPAYFGAAMRPFFTKVRNVYEGNDVLDTRELREFYNYVVGDRTLPFVFRDAGGDAQSWFVAVPASQWCSALRYIRANSAFQDGLAYRFLRAPPDDGIVEQNPLLVWARMAATNSGVEESLTDLIRRYVRDTEKRLGNRDPPFPSPRLQIPN